MGPAAVVVTAPGSPIGHVLAGSGAIDVDGAAGPLLHGTDGVVVVPLAAAFSRPDAIDAQISAWAERYRIGVTKVATVRRADSADESVIAAVASASAVVVLDGAEAHLVGALNRTPLLDTLLEVARDRPVIWSGAAAAAACDPMVDRRGGALTVGLGVIDDLIVVSDWSQWTSETRRRFRRMVPDGRTVVGLPPNSAIHRTPGGGWTAIGEVVAERDGEPVELS